MHSGVLNFVSRHMLGIEGKILEVGSRNINGSVRKIVDIDTGIDMVNGEGVDIVMNACEALEEFGEESFDHVISTDALEHSPEWKCFISNMLGVCKVGGKMLLTAAAPEKGRHDYPGDYWRFTLDMWKEIFKDQKIIEVFHKSPSNGIVIEKVSNSINTDIEPLKVK